MIRDKSRKTLTGQVGYRSRPRGKPRSVSFLFPWSGTSFFLRLRTSERRDH